MEKIEKKYVEEVIKNYSDGRELTDMEKLQALDKSINSKMTAGALIIGIPGILIFGSGMYLAISCSKYIAGSIIGLIGLIICALAIPVKNLIFKKTKGNIR